MKKEIHNNKNKEIFIDTSKQPLIKKDIPHILHLLKENLLVKIITPVGSGQSILPQELSKKYKLIVYNSQKNVEEWYKSNPSELLILFNIGSLNSLRLLSIWKQNPRKILLVTNYKVNIFPTAPTYYIKRFIEPVIEVRYLKNNTDIISGIIKLVSEISNDGNIIIYTVGKDSIETINNKINMKNVFVVDDISFIPNVTTIIDTMKHNEPSTTITGGFREPVSYISKQLADCRSRIGSKDKIVYRMLSKKKFNILDEQIPLSITTIPLHYSIIDIYNLELSPNKVLEDVYSQYEINISIDVMIKHNLIDIDHKLTNRGKFVRGVPFGLRLSILLADWVESYGIDTVYPILVLITMIDQYDGNTPYKFLLNVQNSKVFDFELQYQDHIKKYFDIFRGSSDAETYLNIWHKMIQETEDITIKKWSDLNYIDSKFLESVNNLVNFVSNKLNIKATQFDPLTIIEQMESLISNIFEDKLFMLDIQDTINAKYDKFEIDSFSINTVEEERPLSLYAIITKSTTSKYGNTKTVSFLYVGETDNQKFVTNTIKY